MSSSSFVKIKKIVQDDTTFTLSHIDNKQLDRQYCMDELVIKKQKTIPTLQLPRSSNKTTFGTKSHHVSKEPDEESKALLSTKVNSLGLTNAQTKSFPTMVLHDNANCKKITKQIIVVPDAQTINFSSCHCWYCRLLLPTNVHPLSLPIEYKQREQTFICEGIFCSFNCMKAQLNEIGMYQHKFKNSSMYLSMMYAKIFSDASLAYNDVKPSPSWRLLIPYGGYMTNEVYRNEIQLATYKSLQQHCKQVIKLEIVPEMYVDTSTIAS